MEAQVGQPQAQLAQTQAELQCAVEQIRILTIQGEQQRIGSCISDCDNNTSGHHNRFPLSIAHSESSVWQGHRSQHFRRQQRTDFLEWAENSALYLSTQCVDACEFLLEWLVMREGARGGSSSPIQV